MRPLAVNETMRTQFLAQGFLVLCGLLTAAELAALRAERSKPSGATVDR